MPAVLRPRNIRMSVPQTVAARTRTIISPGAASGSGTSVYSIRFGARNNPAFMASSPKLSALSREKAASSGHSGRRPHGFPGPTRRHRASFRQDRCHLHTESRQVLRCPLFHNWAERFCLPLPPPPLPAGHGQRHSAEISASHAAHLPNRFATRSNICIV